MNQRIQALTARTLRGETYVDYIPTEFDREDLFLPREQREVKQLCEYIMNQEPMLTPYSAMTGYFQCGDQAVVGDAFHRKGHQGFQALKKEFFHKPVDNLSVLEWQHATADYKKLLKIGIRGIMQEIDRSLTLHPAEEQQAFLKALKTVAETLIAWAHKCAVRALDFAETVEKEEYRENLRTLSHTLRRVPEHPPETFYEAVLSIYLCFSADPDSVGTLDRYLRPFYYRDLEAGILTHEEAKEYLQELFLMLQATVPVSGDKFNRGGESHFCIGGYLPDGTDGFDEFSQLILDSLLELPTCIPQVTLRWTAKTPKEVFRYVLDCERKDPRKRIAFQNDEKRLKAYTEICGFPFEKAVEYTTVGCNEPAFLGTINGSTSEINFARAVETLFHRKSDTVARCATFEEFYRVFLEELFHDLTLAYDYDDRYNRERAKDLSYLSSLFFQGTVEKAKSLTQGAGDTVIASPTFMGITNVIDSLIVVKQFVFDEKLVSMAELIAALQADWNGFEALHALIKSKGDFFGNDTPRSNRVARRLYQSLYEFLKNKTNLFGYHWLVGDLVGYTPHFVRFGAKMGATPDGRKAGEPLKFGLGQSGGYDREGLSALLNSIAGLDPNGIGCGSTVTNIMLDEQLIKNDAHFEKTADLLETFFKMGGVHFQLSYVSKEELLRARKTPQQYKNLRVRVSGFSDYFVNLEDSFQEEIIKRTSQHSFT